MKVRAKGSRTVYWVDHPLTEAEKRWRESGYRDDHAPPGYDPDERIMSPSEESDYWAERAKHPVTHITFYGSAPHRPNRPPVKKAAADTE